MTGSPQDVALARAAAGRDFGVRTGHAEIRLALAIAGAGIATLPEFMTEGRSDLVLVSPDGLPLVRHVWRAVQSEMRNATPLRAVVAGPRLGGRERTGGRRA